MTGCSMTFSGRPHSVALARHWLDTLLSPTHRAPVPEETRHTAVLLLSELATNAVHHTRSADGGTYTVHVHLEATTLRVDVEDAGPYDGRPSAPCRADPDADQGRGLALVAAFAETWGPRPHGPGMYFQLSWRSGEPPPLPRRRPGASHTDGAPSTRPIPPATDPTTAPWN